MKQKIKNILQNMQNYNSSTMCSELFGLDPQTVYDVLVVAPSWKPTKIIKDDSFSISALAEHSYISGYLVEKDGLKIAWVQCASGACNLIDHLSICAELKFKKLIFIGAAGSLVKDFNVGDFCTPSCSIAGVYANAYLCDSLSEYTPFEKVYPDERFVDNVISIAASEGCELRKARVFCTDSIALEYSHLDEIRAFDAELVEMETSSFYKLAELFEIPAVALLVVSDNSAIGDPLVGRDPALDDKYHSARDNIIPDMIIKIAKMQYPV